MENLDKKDYFYYTDMIADLKMIAGIGKIDDEFQKERILQILKNFLLLTSFVCFLENEFLLMYI